MVVTVTVIMPPMAAEPLLVALLLPISKDSTDFGIGAMGASSSCILYFV